MLRGEQWKSGTHFKQDWNEPFTWKLSHISTNECSLWACEHWTYEIER